AVVFLGTQCPINNAFLPELARLHEEFSTKGVQFLGVNSNSQDTPGAVAEHARKHNLPFPVLKDVGNVVADHFGAERTPEAVLPILQKRCQDCHRPGQIGPMPLLNYEDAVGWSETIREVVAEKRMPPWYADPKHGKFKNDRRLTDEELKALLSWLDGGMPKGD